MTEPQEPKKTGSGWTVALFAIPVLCCAGPAVLAALGAGSVGALLGGATGSVALAVAGLALICITAAVIARRRTRR
jgi:LPXTG-motif cell wall-anchored protein